MSRPATKTDGIIAVAVCFMLMVIGLPLAMNAGLNIRESRVSAYQHEADARRNELYRQIDEKLSQLEAAIGETE